ncbi:MAG: aminomethyltransferase family protein [Pyrinomonadaceae bacterium]
MSEAIEQVELLRLPLDETHRQSGASMIERDGWFMPAHYGDVAAEYEAVRGGAGAGLFDLSARGRIEVGGAEAVQFLNGLITNDVKALQPGAWMLAAFPNVQGRLLAHARVLRPGEATIFIFDTEPTNHATVFSALERFTLAGDFRVRDLTSETACLSVQGPRAGEIIGTTLGHDAARIERGQVTMASTANSTEQLTIMRATHTGEDGFDLICGANDAPALWHTLVNAGARPCGFDVLETLRIEAGVPRYGADVSETNVVLEAGLEDKAVSYTKGCYVGQEIIARIHWRGHVAKRIAGLSFTGAAGISPGAEVRAADGKKIGRVTSATISPALGQTIALAMLKYDYLQPGTEVIVDAGTGEGAARVVELPFVRGNWHTSESVAEKIS